jgi:F0F1-type ATP synthase alpha subunit
LHTGWSSTKKGAFPQKLKVKFHRELGDLLNTSISGNKLTVPFHENGTGRSLNSYTSLAASIADSGATLKKLEILRNTRIVKIEEKRNPKFQLLTGNIPVDFTNPISEGSFCIFTGKSNTGKRGLMRNTMLRFLQENKDSVVVYNALHKQDATLLKNFLTTGKILLPKQTQAGSRSQIL